jgi:hypothetical protein
LILGEFSFLSTLYMTVSVLWSIARKYFLPLCGWSVQFTEHFFYCAKAF